ncbi:MAG: hypothetical protein ABSB80_09325 [Methanoregula sp.]|jgi:hypothetical protein|uniref:GIY-YIG domain-containing protein n=1 Tax=Methanoregula sp. TaxID=2052170 RepID=UPI003D0EA232
MEWCTWKKIAVKKGFYGDNLPVYDGPAIYQLGVRNPNGGSVSTKYLGRADKLRTRISSYARDGSHLWNDVINPTLNKGYTLYYRYYKVKTPEQVRILEKEHLLKKNYDWNIQNNMR